MEAVRKGDACFSWIGACLVLQFGSWHFLGKRFLSCLLTMQFSRRVEKSSTLKPGTWQTPAGAEPRKDPRRRAASSGPVLQCTTDKAHSVRSHHPVLLILLLLCSSRRRAWSGAGSETDELCIQESPGQPKDLTWDGQRREPGCSLFLRDSRRPWWHQFSSGTEGKELPTD